MSLFGVYYGKQSDVDPGSNWIDPKNVNINGEVVGSFFSGNIEMNYQNDTENVYEYTILFGNVDNNVCIHDIKVLLDENPISIEGHTNTNLERNLYILNEKPIHNYEIEQRFPRYLHRGDYLIIKYVFPNQTLKISVEFEIPIQYISRSSFEILFPLYCCGYTKSYIFKCKNFNFSCNFNSLPLKSNSITSNPKGKINANDSIYIIDHLDPEISYISIIYDLNPPDNSKNRNSIQMPIKSVFFEDGYALCCGKYASITFLPTKKEDEDHSGEEFIFLIDCSKSMKGNAIKFASQCLIHFIKSIPKNCFFNVIRFGSEHIPLFPKPVLYTEENVQKVLQLAIHLEVDLGKETNLYQPLVNVFTSPLSKKNKTRHVFIITDGGINEPNEVLDLVKQVSSNTICNVIGIGYNNYRSFLEEIGQKGFVDFVVSEVDIREKVIEQLDKNLNGKCNIDISFGIVSNIDFAPPLSGIPFNKPVTFFIKSSNDLPDEFTIKIDIEGNVKSPLIIHANSLSVDSKVNKKLEYLFVNQIIKFLLNSNLTEEKIKKIEKLSNEYKIPSPYYTFSGVQKYKSPEEEQKIEKLINDYEKQRRIDFEKNKNSILKTLKKNYDTWLEEVEIFVKLLSGKHTALKVPLNIKIKDLKLLLENESGIRQDRMILRIAGRILEDDCTAQDYHIEKYSTLYITLRF